MLSMFLTLSSGPGECIFHVYPFNIHPWCREFLGKPLSIATLAAFIRLGTKYDIDVLRKEALRRLYYEFPVDFDTFLAADDWTMVAYDNTIYYQVARLASALGIDSLRPMSLYFYCCAGSIPGRYWTSLVNGFLDDESGSNVKLNPQDMELCISAYPKLALLQSRTTYSWMVSDFPPCGSIMACRSARLSILASKFVPSVDIEGLCSWDDAWDDSLCTLCRASAYDRHMEGRREFWAGIPEAFGFGSWSELQNERASSLQ